MDPALIPSFHPATIRQGLTFEQQAEIAGQAGYRYTTIGLAEAVAYDRAMGAGATANLLAGNGLLAGGMSGVPATTASAEEYAQALAALPERCELGRSLGGDKLMIFVPNRAHLPRPEFEILVIERLADIGGLVSEYGFTLAIEWLGPQQLMDEPYPYRAGIQMCLDLADASGRENVGVLVDPAHMFGARQSNSDIDGLAKGRVFGAHIDDFPAGDPAVLVDSDRVMPGDGGIDLIGFCRHTVAAGYRGSIEVELFNPQIRLGDPLAVAREAREKAERVIAAALG